MAQIELVNTETWTLTVTRDGDNWPDIIQGYSRKTVVFPTTIEIRLTRGERASVWVTGVQRKKDGTVGRRFGSASYFTDRPDPDLAWVGDLYLAIRDEYGLTAAGTEVPL
jgi:hypothetical protein